MDDRVRAVEMIGEIIIDGFKTALVLYLLFVIGAFIFGKSYIDGYLIISRKARAKKAMEEKLEEAKRYSREASLCEGKKEEAAYRALEEEALKEYQAMREAYLKKYKKTEADG